jgi:hypothetical protein
VAVVERNISSEDRTTPQTRHNRQLSNALKTTNETDLAVAATQMDFTDVIRDVAQLTALGLLACSRP